MNTMHYSHLTADELTQLIYIDPKNQAALEEVARRITDGVLRLMSVHRHE